MQGSFVTSYMAFVDDRHDYWYLTDKTKGCWDNKFVVWY